MKTLDQNLLSNSYSATHVTKPVHFFYEAAKASAVFLVGDFNHWDPVRSRMMRRVDGWWFVEVYLTHGHHRYRFLVDGKPMLDPRANGKGHDDNGEEVSVVAVS